MVDVLVELYQGVLQDVKVCSIKKAQELWHEWAKQQDPPYKNYHEFLKAVANDEPDSELHWFCDVKVEGLAIATKT